MVPLETDIPSSYIIISKFIFLNTFSMWADLLHGILNSEVAHIDLVALYKYRLVSSIGIEWCYTQLPHYLNVSSIGTLLIQRALQRIE